MPLLSVRLNADEAGMLDSMLGGEAAGTENRTEFVRLMIRREYNRRHKLGKPLAKDWQTAMRIGRPRSEKLTA
jgi:hypothetical protein